MVSGNARAVLAWCATHQSAATRQISGKTCPAVNLDWNGLARAQGFADDSAAGATKSSLAALQELREAGCLAHYYEGPGTFGHTTLCFVPQG